jgi:hypothetical protein
LYYNVVIQSKDGHQLLFFVSASLLSGATHVGTTALSERDFFFIGGAHFSDYLCKQVFLLLLETPITQAPFPRKSFF